MKDDFKEFEKTINFGCVLFVSVIILLLTMVINLI